MCVHIRRILPIGDIQPKSKFHCSRNDWIELHMQQSCFNTAIEGSLHKNSPQGLVCKLENDLSTDILFQVGHTTFLLEHINVIGNWKTTPFYCPFHSVVAKNNTFFGKHSGVAGLEKTPLEQVFFIVEPIRMKLGVWAPWVPLLHHKIWGPALDTGILQVDHLPFIGYPSSAYVTGIQIRYWFCYARLTPTNSWAEGFLLCVQGHCCHFSELVSIPITVNSSWILTLLCDNIYMYHTLIPSWSGFVKWNQWPKYYEQRYCPLRHLKFNCWKIHWLLKICDILFRV